MLPGKRKSLIIWIVSIIGIILVIFAMYNFSKFMRNRGPQESEIIDDAYVEDYLYYGFAIDKDGNYQLMGLNNNFEEEKLGLRSFYAMSNMYYYDDHIILYTDAINQINYNKEENKYFFYEINSFYNNATDVLVTDLYYVFYTSATLEYCSIDNCNRIQIADDLVDDIILLNENAVFYQRSDGVYMYDFNTQKSKIVMLPSPNGGLQLLATDGEYVILLNGGEVYSYQISNDSVTNISSVILGDAEEFSVVNVQNGYLIYQVIDEDGHYNLKKYSLKINNILNNTFDIGNESLTSSMVIDDRYLYAELVDDTELRYVIIDMENDKVVKDLENSYVVLIGVK